ncbi:MAG: beta strand repeat-containing protein, partial [Gemmataceae bacterium]
MTNAANTWGGTVAFTGANVGLVVGGPLALAASSASGTLSLSGTGAITQTGALTVAGTSSLVTSGNLNLDNTANDFGGAVTYNGLSVSLADANDLLIQVGISSENSSLVAQGDITENDYLSIGGWTFLTAGGDINLGTSNTLVGRVKFTGDNVTIRNTVNQLALGNSTALGNLNLTAPSLLSAGTLVANGKATLTLDGPMVAGKIQAAGLDISGATTINQTEGWTVSGPASMVGTGAVVVDHAANDFGDTYIQGTVIVLADANNLVLTGARATNNINLFVGGTLSQTGPMVTGGAVNAQAGGDLLLDLAANRITGPVSLSGANIRLADSTGLVLGRVAATGNLAVDTSPGNGNITQTGPLSVANGSATFNAGTGDIVLTNSQNELGDNGAVAFTARNISYSDVDDVLLGAVAAAGSLLVNAGGDITQNAAINASASGFETTGDIRLTGAGNSFGTLSGRAKNIAFTSSGAMALEGVYARGNLTLNAGGAVTQTGPVQGVATGGALTTINAGVFPVTLNDRLNDFITLTVVSSGLEVADANGLELSGSAIGGNLKMVSGLQTGLTNNQVAGTTTIDAATDILGGGNRFGGTASLGAGRYLWLNGAASSFAGSTYLNGTWVDVKAAGDILLNAGNASILLQLNATGSITQDPAGDYINVSGNSILTAGGDITFTDPKNVFVGDIQATAKNITLTNAGPILLNTTKATGDLTLVAPAGVDQVNPVTVGGTTRILAAGDSVSLTHAGNSLPILAIEADTASVATAGNLKLASATSGSLTLTTGGAVSQGAGITVDQLKVVTGTEARRANLTLSQVSNRLRVVEFAGGAVNIANSASLTLGQSFANGLTLTTQGDLDQSGRLFVTGPLSINANGGDVLLPIINRLSQVAITGADHVTLADEDGLVLTGLSATGPVAIQAAGPVTSSASLTAQGGFNIAARGASVLSGPLAGAGGLVFDGGTTDSLTLSGSNSLTGTTKVFGGTLVVTGNLGQSSVELVTDATLKGTGTVGGIVAALGTVQPGMSPGILTSTGGLNLPAGAVYRVQMEGLTRGTGYSSTTVTGPVAITGAVLDLVTATSLDPQITSKFLIIENDGTDVVAGNFFNLPEGATTTRGGVTFQISYVGGDGNDVVLTAVRDVPPPSGPQVAAPFSLAAGSTVASLGDGRIAIWSATGEYQALYPFPGYTGPLNVSTVNRAGGQNADTVVVAVAGRSAPHVLTIDSATGRVASSVYAFDPKFLGGVTVAGGITRINGEITSVLLCGAGSGSEPSVSVFDAVTGESKGAFYAFSTQYKGGVRVALSEAGADGVSSAIVGSTINSHVVAFDLNNYYDSILSFYTFPDTLTPNGVYVASGDMDGDGKNDVVVGAGQGASSPQ